MLVAVKATLLYILLFQLYVVAPEPFSVTLDPEHTVPSFAVPEASDTVELTVGMALIVALPVATLCVVALAEVHCMLPLAPFVAEVVVLT